MGIFNFIGDVLGWIVHFIGDVLDFFFGWLF